MKVRKLRIPSLYDLCELIIAAVIIVEFNSIWLYLENAPKSKFVILSGVLIISIVVSSITISRSIKARKASKDILFFLVYISIFACIHPVRLEGVFRIGLSAIACIFYAKSGKHINGIPRVLLRIESIMYIITLISLFFWLFGTTLKIIPPSSYVHEVWTGDGRYSGVLSPCYFHVYYSTQKEVLFGYEIGRNTAIFAEAPMASMMFFIALMTDYLLKPTPKKNRCVFYSLAIISTISSTGILLLIVFWSMVLATDSRTKTKFIKFLKYGFLPFVVIIGFILGYKLITEKLASVSGINRMADFVNGFIVWIKKPLFGYGYDEEVVLELAKRLGVKALGYNNSLTPVIVNGGVYLAFPYLYALIKGYHDAIKEKNRNHIIFLLIYTITFLVTITSYKFITFIILPAIVNMGLSGNTKEIYKKVNAYIGRYNESTIVKKGIKP